MFRKTVLSIPLFLCMFSCVTTKSLNYMQKPSDGIPNYVDTVGFSEYAVQKGDYLNIRVYSLNKEDISLYNCNENTSDYNNTDEASSRLCLYVVDEQGDIYYPYIGSLQVLGKTTRQIKSELEDMFKRDIAKYVSVDVSLVNLPVNQTYSALKILELSGYIELTDELDNPSVLQFVATRDELYRFRSQNPQLERLIEVLLRSYTGLFAQSVHIDEDTIARRLDTDRNAVYENLVRLHKIGIVRYVPFKKTPLLIYTQRRVDNADLVIPKSVYDARRERYVRQIEAVLEYAEDTEICLNSKLLDYFGEKTDRPCGICSVCREQRAKNPNTEPIEEAIAELLCKKQYDIDDIAKHRSRCRATKPS